MKKEELAVHLPETEKLPIGSLTWDCRASSVNSAASVKVISAKHNTDCYPIQILPKPISKIIDFAINNKLDICCNGSN